jgi:hypothetical protein
VTIGLLTINSDASPLLDQLGAVIDHVKAFSAGGAHDISNFVPACAKCNMRKSAELAEEFRNKHPLRSVKGKYGEPQHWEGFSALFVLMIRDDRSGVTRSEMEWYRALSRFFRRVFFAFCGEVSRQPHAASA